MKSEKLLESTIKALQGKLTEDEDFTKRKRLTGYQKFLVLKDLYKKLDEFMKDICDMYTGDKGDNTKNKILKMLD